LFFDISLTCWAQSAEAIGFNNFDRLVFSGLYRLAPGMLDALKDAQAGNADRLAPRRLPLLLALEIKSTGWPTQDSIGDSSAHSRRESCEPDLGCTADPRRTPHARHRCRANDRSQIHGEAKATAVARMEDLSSQSHRWHRVDGFVCRPHGVVSAVIRIVILQHRRRLIVWLGVTAHPTAEWIARHLTEAYAWAQAPQYIIRDRDRAYGDVLIRRLRAMGIRDRPIAPRSPWQNGHTERLIGSIRRDCLDHVVVFGERHFHHLLGSYQRYYNDARTHLSLDKENTNVPRH
jgi:transposase InsO family protein